MPRADHRQRFRLLPSLAVLALVSVVSACAQQQIAPEQPRVEAPRQAPPAQRAEPAPPPPTEVEDGYRRVALLVPRSGRAADVGQALLNAAQMAVFDVADDRFVLQPYDTQGTPDGARAAMDKALSEGAQLVLGPLFADNVRAVAPQAQAAGVNVVSFSTDTSAAADNVYVMGLLLSEQAEALVRFARGQNMDRFAVLAPSTAYGRAMADALRDVTARANAAVVQVEYFNPGGAPDEAIKRLTNPSASQAALERQKQELAASPDPVAQRALQRLQQIQGSGDIGFQALLLPESGQQLREIAALLPYYGVRPEQVQYMGTMLWNDDRRLGQEPALVGAVFPAPSPQSNDYFTRRYGNAYGTTPPAIANVGYDATALAAVLAKRNETAPFDARALTNPEGFVGVDGLFRLRQDGTVERGFAILRVTRDGAQVVAPAPESFPSAAGS
ncbi:penicillin-binding protein activator [Caenispirillum salinarum]|uniref:penicillin-binding protein activator n=1 Tax=Caenispirillum salinarum TaxID=859058 RepID=UPI0005B931E4|nr:penicillin-binding protein activator [Caenispirillum salinarum]